MSRILRISLIVFVLALAVGAAVYAIKGPDIKRLATVNTLFDADKIVDNFSHMDRAFLTRDLDVPIRDDWTVNEMSLPDTILMDGKQKVLEEVLNDLDMTSLIIVRKGEIVHEQYDRGTGPDDRRISWSVAKSFLSGLYGNALADGDIGSLDDDITDYVPELAGTAYEGANLRNILNMSSGVLFNEDYLDLSSDINAMGRVIALGGSLDDYTIGLKDRDFEPGDRWKYVSLDTHVAAWALRNATGRTIHDLWEETYGPLGFRQTPYFLVDGKGVAFALGGLNLTSRDYAKFGQLYLQNGAWKGEQLIPADWIAASTRHSAPSLTGRGTGYGYQWWIPMPAQGDYLAAGIYGQYIYVDPSRHLVIVKTGADREFTEADEFGPHSMNATIAMMRGLAEKFD